MLKDLRLAEVAASSVGASTPLGVGAGGRFAPMNERRHGNIGFSGGIRMLRGPAERDE